jgi:ribosomal protein S12 methylthiotransferase
LPDHRAAVTPRHFAYLKISEGCDRLCTFCAIPKMRGKHASKPIEQIVDEARRLAESGVREINVVAQDTTYYGRDLYGEPRLTELLVELDRIDGWTGSV